MIELEEVQKPISLLIDTGTGEVKGEIYEGDKVRILRKRQLDYVKTNAEEINKERMYYFGQDENFGMISEFASKQLADEKLTATEYRIVLIMMANTHYKSGLIAFKNNIPLSIEWLAKKLNISIKTAEKSINTLIDKGIIAQNTTHFKTKYFFNPFILYKGRWINRTLYEMFRNTKWAKRDKK